MNALNVSFNFTKEVIEGLSFLTTIVFFIGVGFLLGAFNYHDKSIIGEIMGWVAALSSLVYSIHIWLHAFNFRKIFVSTSFLVATGSYLYDGFDDWTVTILLFVSVSLYAFSGIYHGKKTDKEKTHSES